MIVHSMRAALEKFSLPAKSGEFSQSRDLPLVILVPWNRYLSGFALYQSYSSFPLIRYAPQIFFLGLLAAVAGIPLLYFLRSRPTI